jgi:hypothetical protein
VLRFTSTDPGDRFGAVTNDGNGIYTVTITSSTTVGVPTITVIDTSVTPNLTATAPLDQTALVVAAAVPAKAVLAFTGASTTLLVALSAALLAAGGGLLALARRPRPGWATPGRSGRRPPHRG